jgi:branched-chain amino acid transport system substrate-binding protein
MRRGSAATRGATLVAALLLGCGPGAGPKLRVGVLLPLTGAEAAYGDSFKKGCVLALAEELARPGGQGSPFELRYRDVGADARDAEAALRELAEAGRVPAAIAMSSAVTLSAGPAADQTHTVLVSALGTAPEISLLGEWVYRTGTTDVQEGIAMAQHCIRKGLSRVAVLHPDTPQGQGQCQVFRESFEAKGGTLAEVVAYAPGQQEFGRALDALKKSRPGAVYFAGTWAEALTLLRQARARKLLFPLLGTSALYVNELLRQGGADAEGVLFTQPSFEPGSEEARTAGFVRLFRERYGETPDLYSAAAYDACRLLIATVRVGGGDSAAVRRALDAVEGFGGVLGETTFDHNGDATRVPLISTVLHGAFARLP